MYVVGAVQSAKKPHAITNIKSGKSDVVGNDLCVVPLALCHVRGAAHRRAPYDMREHFNEVMRRFYLFTTAISEENKIKKALGCEVVNTL